MEREEFRSRVIALAKAAGVYVLNESDAVVRPTTCWVDARVSCPYGMPHGQYILRPTGFCKPECMVYTDHVHALQASEREREEAVTEFFNDQHVSITSQVRAAAEELEEQAPAEAAALELAADVIDQRKLDQDILLREDLPR